MQTTTEQPAETTATRVTAHSCHLQRIERDVAGVRAGVGGMWRGLRGMSGAHGSRIQSKWSGGRTAQASRMGGFGEANGVRWEVFTRCFGGCTEVFWRGPRGLFLGGGTLSIPLDFGSRIPLAPLPDTSRTPSVQAHTENECASDMRAAIVVHVVVARGRLFASMVGNEPTAVAVGHQVHASEQQRAKRRSDRTEARNKVRFGAVRQ